MIYDSEAPSFDVALKSPEIVREDSRIKFTRESLLSLSEEDICKGLPAGIVLSIFRDLRISYTREHLISLAEVNECKKLPCGLDQTTISDLQDPYKRPPEINEQQHHESVSAGGFQEASKREYHERWNSFKSAPEIQKLQAHESLSAGRMAGASTEESTARWDSFKLTNADGKCTDSEKLNSHQLRRPLVSPTTMSILKNASQNPEKNGILGSWSGTKPTPGRSEVSTLKLPGSESLLSRCSQPYRPPSYYKAMSHPETPRHEEPSKQRVTDERWRKDLFDLKTSEPLLEIEEKPKSSEGDEKAIPKSGARRPLEEHSALQVINRFRVAPPTSPSVSASAESPRSNCETTESCPTEDSVDDQPLLQGEEVTYLVEKLEPQILEGGRFSALVILKDSEDVDPDLIQLTDEANLASNVKRRDDHKIIEGSVGFSKTNKKGLRAEAAPFTKSTAKTTSSIFPNSIKSSAVNVSMSSAVLVKPSSKISNFQGGFVADQQKGIDIDSESLQKGFAEKTSNADYSATEAKVSSGCSLPEIWPSSDSTEPHDITMDIRDSCKPDSESIYWFSDNDEAHSSFSSWPDLSGNNIWRTSTGMFTMGNLLDKGQSREASIYGQEFLAGNNDSSHNRLSDLEVLKTAHDLEHTFEEVASRIAEGSKVNPSSHFDDEADSNFEINLPDEDSLITVDDIFIFQEDMLNQSPEIPLKGGRITSHFSGLNKPVQMNNLHQNLILPDPWFHDSQSNVAKPFANPSNTQTNFRAPLQPHDPWRFYHHNYGLSPVDPFSIGQLPVMPPVYEPSHWNFLSPKVPMAHNFYPCLNNTLRSEPPPYHQVHQMPWSPKKSDVLGTVPQNYQGNKVNSTYMGMRGCHGEEETRPTFSQVLRMQIAMAKMKLEADPGFKAKAICKPISNQHR